MFKKVLRKSLYPICLSTVCYLAHPVCADEVKETDPNASLNELISSFKTPLPVEEVEYEECKIEGNSWEYATSIRHIEGKGAGYKTGYTTLEGVVFFNTGSYLLNFVDLRGHFFDDGKTALNLGFGTRFERKENVYGLNLYYDFRDTRLKTYHQIAMGFEKLGKAWDFRANIYWPLGTGRSDFYHIKFHKFKQNSIILSKRCELAMRGIQGEAGTFLGKFWKMDFFVAGGPYYYNGGKGANILGAKVRLKGQYSEKFGFEFLNSYDGFFGNIFQGKITFTFPFVTSFCKSAERSDCNVCGVDDLKQKMRVGVVREEIITIKDHRKNATAVDPSTGQPYTVWFVDNTSHSAGTYKSPFPTLAEAEAASKPGDIIYVFPGDQTSTGMSSGIVLQNNQRLWGASVAHGLPTTLGNVVIPSEATRLPVLTNSTGDVVAIANNNEVSGFYIQNLNGNGISQANAGVSIANFTATQNMIVGNGTNHGLELQNIGGTLEVAKNTINSQSLSMNIASSNIQNASYQIKENNFNISGISLQLTNSSNISTLIANNSFLGYSTVPIFNATLSNATAQTLNSFLFVGNVTESGYSLSSLVTPITYNLYNYANANIQMVNNNMSTLNSINNIFNVYDNSKVDISLENNIFKGEENVKLVTAGQASASLNMSGNKLIGDNSGDVFISHGSSNIVKTSITNNEFIIETERTNPSFAVLYAVTGNGIVECSVIDNQFYGGGLGFEITGSPSICSEIKNNKFSLIQSYGILITEFANTMAKWDIESNVFDSFGAVGAVSIQANAHSVACVRFMNNQAYPVTGAYQFFQNNLSATFYLEPMSGNIGDFSGSAITPNVPANACDCSN